MKVKFKINLTKKQTEAYELFHDADVKELVMVFSRQSGKSTLCEILAIETMLTKKVNCVYITPNFVLGKKIYREICNLLAPTNLIKAKNSSDLTIQLLNGSTLTFFSAQSPQSIRGFTCSGALFIDEAAYISDTTSDGQDFFNMIVKPITKARKPKVVWVSTPNGKSGTFYEKYLDGNARQHRTRTVKCDIYQDSTLTPEEVAELKETTPPLAWQQEYEVQFLDSALTVFQGFENQFVPYKDLRKKVTKKTWIGLDLSANGEDSTILTKLYDNMTVEQFLIEGTLDQKYQKIADIINDTKDLMMCYMEANGIGEPIINEIRKKVKSKSKCLYYTTTHENKNENVGNLALKISQKEIFFNEDDKELYHEMGVFTYKVNKMTRSVSYAAKPPYHDDRIMSLLLALRAKDDYPNNSVQNNYRIIGSRTNGIR